MFSSYVRLKYRFIEREPKSTPVVVEVEGLGHDNDCSGRMGVDALDKHLFAVIAPILFVRYPIQAHDLRFES